MLSKQQKIELAGKVGEIIKSNPNLVFVDFTGIKTGELIGLKRELKKEGLGFKSLKKSLLSFAFKNSGKEEFDLSNHKSSIALVYGSAEPTTIAKILHTFSIKQKMLNILGGFFANEKVLKNTVTALALLPSREVLLSQVVQLLMSPVSGFARVLDGISKKEKVVS